MDGQGEGRHPIRWLKDHLAHRQHRNAYYLIGNGVAGAATGFLFWVIFARFAHLPPSEIGVGYSMVALGTTIGLIAKGGLDTALLRSVPTADRRDASALLRFAITIGSLVALLLTAGLWTLNRATHVFADANPSSILVVALIGILLVVTWLQDAYFLAEGDARHSFMRNLVFSGARLLLPLPIVLLAVPRAVPFTWMLALGVSALAAAVFAHRFHERDGRRVPRREFLKSAARNLSGSAAEFLPGLLLAPLVLALGGPAQAAYFGIAWTAASLLFLASAAICRSTLAELVRGPPERHRNAIRRAVRQHLYTVLPAALLAAALAPELLLVFGRDYAANGALVLMVLAASVAFVAPAYLYLAVLRAHERPLSLTLFPAAMVLALAILAPLLEETWGLPGVALAWLAANVPFGLYGAWKLRLETREVTLPGPAAALPRAPNLE